MQQLPVIHEILRTPESRFANLSDFPYVPHYTEVGGLRIAYMKSCPLCIPGILFTDVPGL